MRLNFFFFFVLALLVSCSQQNEFPEKISKKIPIEDLILKTNTDVLQTEKTKGKIDFSDLNIFISKYEEKDTDFDFNKFEEVWSKFLFENDILKLNTADLKKWIDITGLLLELTTKTLYAEELERVSELNRTGIQKSIAPYILTRSIDHIYVNLFEPVETKFSHTLGGEVRFKMETDYPKSGSIKLHFKMTERRYIELFIRIPSWAEGSMVTVKQVKYIATPGTYCKIAKKWKEGDIVEIQFPSNRNPNYPISKLK